MLAPLLRWASDQGICSLPSFDGPLTREYKRHGHVGVAECVTSIATVAVAYVTLPGRSCNECRWRESTGLCLSFACVSGQTAGARAESHWDIRRMG
eukprot:5756967-Pyramimonas_sp.AAC.1